MNKSNRNLPKNIGILLLMLLVITGLSAIAFTGIDMVIFEIPSVYDGIKLGLDLRGGSIISYDIQTDEDVTNQQFDSVISMLRQRVDANGLTETSIYQSGEKRITLEIPDMTNPDEAVAMIGSTAKLEFRDSEGKIWLTGDMVESADSGYGDATGSGTSQYLVTMTFKSEYADLWAEATKTAANRSSGENYIALYMDNEPVKDPSGSPFQPSVGTEFAATGITGGECVVTFGTYKSSSESANSFANLVNIGQLPFELTPGQIYSVGPTLGETSLRTSLIAGFISLAVIIVFMICFYRLPGLVAAIALAFYTALIVVILSIIRVNLSLPGIAGIILSIAMAVDANVIIYERIKEELRFGKTVRSAIDAGFRRAAAAIIDSNLTTVMISIVLMVFGTGPIQGFAITLFVGVLLSMFTVFVVSRLLLKQIVTLGITNLSLYGVSKTGKPAFFEGVSLRVSKTFKVFAGISGVICLFAIVCLVLLPFGVTLFNLDIDFAGGTSVLYETKQELSESDLNRFSDVVFEVTGSHPSAPQKTENTQVLVKASDFSAEQRTEALEKLKEFFPEITAAETNDVGSLVSSDLQKAAIYSVIVSALLMLLYITVRFQFSSGLAAVLALLHDVMVVVVAYVVLQIPINMNFIAVMLTVLGYSINSTIIIFDRVRENRRLMQKSLFAEIVDKSVRQTLLRNINTTLTTLLPICCIIILGVPSIRNFAIPLAIGIAAGAYSSIFISAPVWGLIRKTEK